MKSFNQLLKERIKLYFKQKYNLDLFDETANEYLNSLADMFGVFAESGEKKPPDVPLQRAGGGDPPASPT